MTDSIFAPRFTLTPSIEAALELVDQRDWLISHMLLMPKHQAWIRRDVRTSRAHATTAIEGEGINLEYIYPLTRPAGLSPALVCSFKDIAAATAALRAADVTLIDDLSSLLAPGR